jgi:hypothetical protein
MITVIFNGDKKEIDLMLFIELLIIPISPFDPAYWEDNHLQSPSFDLQYETFDGVISLGEDDEIQQVDESGVRNFSISKFRWENWPTENIEL